NLGHYTSDRVVGRGGMGTVYCAVDERTDTEAAVKILSSALADDEHFRIRFETEIEALKMLRHPHIVELYGYGEQEGELFYAMELVAGRTLHDELRLGRRFDWQEVVRIGIDICKALRHAHDRGIIHRDLKPANLLITDDQQIKLLDFGIAKLFGSTKMTADGGIMGTADYMSPEQAEGNPATIKSDLYSLGSVLFTLLAGRPPFVYKTLPEVIHALRFEDPPSLGRFVAEMPSELEHVMERLLCKDPDDRIPTAQALVNLQSGIAAEQTASQQADQDSDFTMSDPALASSQSVEASSSPDEISATINAPVGPNSAELSSENDSEEAADSSPPTIDHEMDSDDHWQENLSPAAEPTTHYTTVTQEYRRKHDDNGETGERSSLLKNGALIALAALLLGIIVYSLWPASSDRLYSRINTIAQQQPEEIRKAEETLKMSRFYEEARKFGALVAEHGGGDPGRSVPQGSRRGPLRLLRKGGDLQRRRSAVLRVG
ncbi:MAG: serine/threonine protein kinase, partial [Chloroflexi bacterium]|nr:serine/threonine protein kinase [Chloroflexota bacterium]